MPAYRGLYAAALPPIVAAFLASSPHLQTGPTALTALLAFATLSALAPPGSAEYVELVLLLALVVGAVRIAVGLLRAGVVAYLMSHAVMVGFVPAATALIVASQLPAALGVAADGGGIIEEAVSALTEPDAWDAAAVVLSVTAIALVRFAPRVHPLFPGVLVAVAIGMLAVELAGIGGATVGEVPAGLPPLSVDLPWGDLPSLVLGGAVIALVGFAEPASVARTLAAKERQPWDADREFVSQGAANVAAGLTGGFPVGGSFSRSALNQMAGGKTRWSGAVTGLAVLAILPVAGILESIPIAVLGAVVIAAVLPMLDLRPVFGLWRPSRPQFLVAAATFALTIALSPHVERAVAIGVGLALAVHLWRELRVDLDVFVADGIVHIHPRGVLWFATAPALEDRLVRVLAQHRGLGRLVLHLEGVGRLDMSAALALRNAIEFAEGADLDVEVCDVPAHARRLVRTALGREASDYDAPAGHDSTEKAVKRDPKKFDPARAHVLDSPNRERYLPTDVIVDLLDLRGDLIVLDYGAGTGRLALAVADALGGQGRIIAVDESDEMMALLRERSAGTAVEPLLISENRVPLSAGSVDRVLAVNLLHEVRDEGALDEIRRLLAPAGFALVVDWARGRNGNSGPPDELLYTEDEAIAALASAGLEARPAGASLPYHYALRAAPTALAVS
jgi:SulP family sulfate permease